MIISYEEACQTIQENVPEVKKGIRLPLEQVRDLIVAEDITAAEPLPPRNFSAMNGYAVRAEDTRGATREFPLEMKMVHRLKTGEVHKRALGKNEVIRVAAGALLPESADAVVLSDDADRVGHAVKIYRTVSQGENVRVRGEDVAEGEVVIKRGRRIRPQEMAMLAAMGFRQIEVFPRPTVAILTTGDELAPLSGRKNEGQVWNCLTPMIKAMVEETGGMPVEMGHVKESAWGLQGKIKQGLKHSVLILAGGVFVRDYDLIKEVLDKLRVKEIFWRVNMRPGRPIYFGRSENALVFGLPDTPGGVYIGFEEFVRPAILKRLGRERLFRREITAAAGTDLKNRSGRTFFIRSFLRRNGRNVTVFPSGNQHSHIIKTLSRSNALVTLSEDIEFIRKGDRVKVKVMD